MLGRHNVLLLFIYVELAFQVKNIPLLSSRISCLKEERERLQTDLAWAKTEFKKVAETQKPVVPPRPELRTGRDRKLTTDTDLSPTSPPETPDSRPAPRPPPRSTSVERMRETVLSPAPPPPIPPKPRPPVSMAASDRLPLMSTPSGNFADFEEFHSVRRIGGPKIR